MSVICSAPQRVIAGFKINEESLSLDMVKKIGPAGDFMAEEHTLKHYRKDIWYPNIFMRDRFDNWQASGAKDIAQYAREQVQELLEKQAI